MKKEYTYQDYAKIGMKAIAVAAIVGGLAFAFFGEEEKPVDKSQLVLDSNESRIAKELNISPKSYKEAKMIGSLYSYISDPNYLSESVDILQANDMGHFTGTNEIDARTCYQMDMLDQKHWDSKYYHDVEKLCDYYAEVAYVVYKHPYDYQYNNDYKDSIYEIENITSKLSDVINNYKNIDNYVGEYQKSHPISDDDKIYKDIDLDNLKGANYD